MCYFMTSHFFAGMPLIVIFLCNSMLSSGKKKLTIGRLSKSHNNNTTISELYYSYAKDYSKAYA